ARALHQPAGQSAGERRKRVGAIAQDLNQLSAQAKDQHWPELRIAGAAHNQFMSLRADHGLDRYALESILSAERSRDVGVGGAHCRFVFQIELDSAFIGFVGHRLRVQLEHNGKSDSAGLAYCLVSAVSNSDVGNW